MSKRGGVAQPARVQGSVWQQAAPMLLQHGSQRLHFQFQPPSTGTLYLFLLLIGPAPLCTFFVAHGYCLAADMSCMEPLTAMYQLTKLYCSNFGDFNQPRPDGDAASGFPVPFDDLTTTIEGYDPLELRNKVSSRGMLADMGAGEKARAA
jgi:hypothetical protein